MTMNNPLHPDLIEQDKAARSAALDIRESFIVQAPAGSGKTGLLIQRYLALLAEVERPEQILAITFTKKAASEMRERVLSALHRAQHEPEPITDPHAQITWQLARKVVEKFNTINKLQNSPLQHWSLDAAPQRLRIQTIDSFNSELVARMPLASRIGGALRPTENALPLYREAARRVLAKLEQSDEFSDSVAALLEHLDNYFSTVEKLLTTMLQKRDQWLRHVNQPGGSRLQQQNLETAWHTLCTDLLEDLQDVLPQEYETEICALARYAASHLLDAGASPIITCAAMENLPEPIPEELAQWQGITELLMSKEGAWRKPKGVNVKLGFPPASGTRDKTEKDLREAMLARIKALLESLHDEIDLGEKLHAIRLLPRADYQQSQWRLLDALLKLLPQAVDELRNVFSERGECDFNEIAQGAVNALGNADDPTDLMLSLDYRLRHILIDEFQDTSVTQFELLTRLTAGWEPDDGRSLFIVGDPMQSIYRFREADVRLFLRAIKFGVGNIRPTYLLLSRNFRSQQGIVDWVNHAFAKVFPAQGDLSSGAVSYAQSASTRPVLPGAAVQVHALWDTDWKTQQAEQIAHLIRDALQQDASQSIVVLARSRGHLAHIVYSLNQLQVAFTAVEIDNLSQRPLVQDLCALTRAHLNLADRSAWLACLRAPWCGLTLADLGALAEGNPAEIIYTWLNNPENLAHLSPDGQRRVKKFTQVLNANFAHSGRKSLRPWIEAAWLALGGPACAENPADLEDAATYFDMLDDLPQEKISVEDLELQLSHLYARQPVNNEVRVQVMTMHKSKGLEFDVVILPSLSAKPRNGDSPLLLWQEYISRNGENHLLLAPITRKGEAADAMYRLAKEMEARRDHYESQRLLYVACTRAKRQLHLFGHAELAEDGCAKPPVASSLMSHLWPVMQMPFQQAAKNMPVAIENPAAGIERPLPYIRRLPSDWEMPALNAPIQFNPKTSNQHADTLTPVEYLWVGDTARHVGSVAHHLLRRIADQGISRWNVALSEKLRAVSRTRLMQLGIAAAEIDSAIARVMEAVRLSVEDQRGRWILDNTHKDSATELAVTSIVDGEIINIVIDRTFIDEHGTRWIIDYKTSSHEGADKEKFLDNEVARYQDQLNRYRIVMMQLDARPIKCGLYFPLLGGWREW